MAGVDISDEVMKRRLLIDGDGGGDDRRILGLTRSFLSWIVNDENEEESKVSFRRIINQLNQIEHGHDKTHFAIRVNEEAKSYYEHLDLQVKDEIEKAKDQIEHYKELLEKAKEHRKNRTEYNALARIIKTKPDRKETEAKRLTLERDLKALQNERKGLDDKLEQRKRNMQVLVSAIYQLGDLLDQEDQDVVTPNRNNDKTSRLNTLMEIDDVVPSNIASTSSSSSLTVVAVANNNNSNNIVEPMSICVNSSSSDKEQGENSSNGSIVPISSSNGGENNGHTSNPGSPRLQVAQQEEGTATVSIGTVSSVPLSPKAMTVDPSIEKTLEKYDDLSESDNESGENN